MRAARARAGGDGAGDAGATLPCAPAAPGLARCRPWPTARLRLLHIIQLGCLKHQRRGACEQKRTTRKPCCRSAPCMPEAEHQRRVLPQLRRPRATAGATYAPAPRHSPSASLPVPRPPPSQAFEGLTFVIKPLLPAPPAPLIAPRGVGYAFAQRTARVSRPQRGQVAIYTARVSPSIQRASYQRSPGTFAKVTRHLEPRVERGIKPAGSVLCSKAVPKTIPEHFQCNAAVKAHTDPTTGVAAPLEVVVLQHSRYHSVHSRMGHRLRPVA